MGNSLSIDKEDIRGQPQFSRNTNQERTFTEAEETWDVLLVRCFFRTGLLHKPLLLTVPDHRGNKGRLPVVGYIHPTHEPRFETGVLDRHNLGCDVSLYRDDLGYGLATEELVNPQFFERDPNRLSTLLSSSTGATR